MLKKTISFGLFIILFTSIMLPITNASHEQLSWWDKNWNFRQELIISLPAEDAAVRFQPIDMYISFENQCWTKNEIDTSVRVCCWHNNRWNELESQLYDFEFTDKSDYISECRVVFIIPAFADGNERYFIYYNNIRTPSVAYSDHVNLIESYFYQEPIPGQKAETTFYGIQEENYFVYYVAQKGVLTGQWMAQAVVKLEKNTTEIKSDAAGHIALFSFSYYRGMRDEDMSSTGQKFVSKEIIQDGNLMVQFRITSESFLGEIRTTNIYTYYYCPSEDKRIHINVNHEAIQEARVGEGVDYWDGSYASLTLCKSRSNSIKDLNFGELYPYLHVYSNDDATKEYYLDPDPSSKETKLFLPASDMCYLGEKAWVSFDNEEGATRAIILASNKGVIKSGSNEKDGIQVRGFDIEYINIPGLEVDLTSVHLMRNSYESGVYDRVIPKDFNVAFNAEFFTSEKGGYSKVDKEAEMFNLSVRNQQREYIKDDINEGKNEKRYDLTVYAHFTPSFPLGAFLSVITGKNFSYLTAELYQEKTQVATGSPSRIKTESSMYLNEDLNFMEKIKTYRSLLDIRNSSFFKSIKFNDLPEGEYIVKIFREHPLFKEGREFIGLYVVTLKEDTKTHVICKREGSVHISVSDQNKNSIENAKVCVFLDDYFITEDLTDENGEATINLPYLKSPYKLKVFYNNFNTYDESFELKLFQLRKPLKFSVEIPLYNTKFRIVDNFGLSPGIKLKPTLSSLETVEPTIIKATKTEDNIYTFNNLYSSNYKFRVNYKTFDIEENFQIPYDKELIDINFPAEFDVRMHLLDSLGISLGETKIYINRDSINLEYATDDKGITSFSLPPGEYSVKSFENEIKIMVAGEEEIFLVTEKTPEVFSYVTALILVLIIIFLATFLLKKISLNMFIKVFPLILLIIALIMPWWQLNGLNQNRAVEYSVSTYPWSQKIISKTTIEGYNYLEISTVPDIVNQFLIGVLFITILCIFCISLSMISDLLKKPKIEKFLIYGSLVLLVIAILIFSYGIDQLSTVGMGSICGNGLVKIDIPSTSEYIDVNASWCFAIGFYLCLISFAALIMPRVIIKKLH